MAKRQIRESIDNLSYAPNVTPYAKAPVKEILALTANKEADYIETKNAINLTESLKKTMPYHESSKGIYDEMVSTIDNSLSAITPENYSDNTLNTQQIAIDAMNKYGGIELGKQKADYDAKAAAIAAFPMRAEKKAYKLAEMAKNTEPITKDEKGNFVVKPVPTPRLVPDQDIPAKLDGFLKDWKANTLYTYNADGTLNVSKELAGKLGITKTEQITEEELRSAAMSYLELDPNIQEYLDDEADFMTKGRGMGIEELYKALSPAQLETLVPGKKATDITAEDVRLATEGKEGMLQTLGNHLLKKSIKDQYVKGYSDLYANKYSYTKDEKTFVDDVEFIEATKAKYATPKVGSNDAPPLVTISPLTTLQKVSPTSMVELDKSIDAYAKNQPELIQKLKGFENLLKTAKTDADILSYNQSIADTKELIEKNDTAIQQAQQQKRNITQSVFTIGETNGVAIDATYEKEKDDIIEITNQQNISKMVSRGFETPFTPTLKASLEKAGQGDIPIIDKNDSLAIKKQEVLSSDYVLKDGKILTYIGVPTATTLSGANGKATAVYNTIDKKAIKFTNPDDYFREPATKEQYREAVAQAYLNPDYESWEEDFVVNYSVNKLGKELRKIKDVGEAKVNQTFDALYVDPKAGPKTAASEINELTKKLKKSVMDSASSFKVYNEVNELIDLPLHVKSLGIDMSADYIDYTKFNPGLLLNADREYGQKLNLSLPLTAKGRELVREKMGVDFFEGGDAITLVGVESSGKEGVFNTQLGSSIARVYAESFKDLSAGGEESRKVLGTMAFNNSKYSKDFYSKNLYSLAPGTNVKFEADGGNVIRINAARRTPNPKKMSDNDYFITDEKESATFVYDKTTGRSNFVKNEVLKADKATKYQIQYFASPEDIGGLLGKSMLNNQMYNLNSQATQNTQTKTTGRSYTVAPEKVIANDYNAIVNNVVRQYGTKAKPTLIADASGNEKSYSLRVPASQLSNLQTYIPDNIDGANLPYVHNSIVNKVVNIVEEYGLTVTGALRDEKKNAFTKGSAENSLHQYGFSTDHRYNANAKKLLAFAEANPSQLPAMGINNIFKHTVDSVPHLHIDYNS